MDDPARQLAVEYHIQSIEFRDGMTVVNYTEAEQLKRRFVQNHTSAVIFPGDPDVDAKIEELHDDALELITLAHIANREPPARKPI